MMNDTLNDCREIFEQMARGYFRDGAVHPALYRRHSDGAYFYTEIENCWKFFQAARDHFRSEISDIAIRRALLYVRHEMQENKCNELKAIEKTLMAIKREQCEILDNNDFDFSADDEQPAGKIWLRHYLRAYEEGKALATPVQQLGNCPECHGEKQVCTDMADCITCGGRGSVAQAEGEVKQKIEDPYLCYPAREYGKVDEAAYSKALNEAYAARPVTILSYREFTDRYERHKINHIEGQKS